MSEATMPVRTDRVRNVALVGHAGSGTTTLAEAMLVASGARTRAGRVEDGTTVCDHDAEEIARGSSVTLAVADLAWTPPGGEPHHVTLLDTPGSPDFAGAADAALAVADVALLAVSAVDGVQPGTLAAWRRAAELDLPVIAVITKEDKQRADFHTVLVQLRELAAGSGMAVVPLELPLGEESALHGLADVLTDTGVEYDGAGHHTVAVPADVEQEERALHEEVAEEIVSHDDAQLERYLDGDEPAAAELEATLRREVAAREALPVLLVSAQTGVGVAELLTYVCELAPSPADRPARVVLGRGEDAVLQEVVADPDGELVLQVFRTLTDPFVGLVSFVKVLSGSVRGSAHLVNAATGATERVHAPFRLRGAEHLPTDAVVAGQIVGVAKLTDSPTGSLLAANPGTARPLLPTPPTPGYAVALVPERPGDEERLPTALARLVAADPTLVVDRPDGQTVLRGLGDQHVAVAVERMARLLGVQVRTEPVQVAYTETIAREVEVEGRLKKQSGGHGQFAVVQLRVSPLARGEGLRFVDRVVGGSVPRQFIPAVERGVQDAMAGGGPRGHRVVDLQVELLDGKAHSVDSSEMAFRTAAASGVRAALEQGGSVLLEPMVALTVRAPLDVQGDVMGDIAARRGQVTGTSMSEDGGDVVVTARVPASELDRYLLDLRAMTHGRGEMVTEPAGYEVSTAQAG
ncbi:translation factor GTPase family protein [Miniimonas sp. S16]|uniref:elongation factor G n=1 Tax=Miniimonas sp. S16 TaxID=2171623 RepID=UPI000D5296A3|nr:elongation factor G [Miniimonas sp. S16]